MTTKKIIEADICATCVNVCLLEPPPPSGPWEKKALCTAGWPYTRVFASANAIDECPQYERVMQPSRPWPFPPAARGVNPSDGSQPRPPTNEDMDRIYDGVLRQFAERLEIRPDEVNVDPKTHPSFYRALMHAAWLDGALAHDGPVPFVPRTDPTQPWTPEHCRVDASAGGKKG